MHGGLRVTHEFTVREDQIDHLGHMNVRFYAVAAREGTDALLAELPGWGGRPHVVHDLYTRHLREQLLGTRLVVRSGLIAASADGLTLHHELAAADTGVLAAAFVYRVAAVGEGGRVHLPAPLVEGLAAEVTPAPDYAVTRTISLAADGPSTAPALAQAVELGLALRRPRPVTADECDAAGRYRVDMAPLLTWGGEPIGDDRGGALDEGADGTLMGWASMETRLQAVRLPRVGDSIQSFGACVAVHDKVTHRVHWAFDLERGELLTAFETVSMAFDIRARRPMSIPPERRARDLATLQPDLAPQALA
jgi:acyl-CoA thioesterase FadM